MQFTKFLVAAAAFTLANAQVEFTMNADFFAASYVAGVSVMNLTWDLNSGPVTLKLMNGPSTNLSLVETIKSGVTGTSYPYTPSTNLAAGQYAFEIDDSSSKLINYSKQFALTGGSASTVTSTGSTSSATPSPTSNSTSTSTTNTKTTTKTSSSPTSTSSSTTPKINSATSVASPLALILLAFAAMVSLN